VLHAELHAKRVIFRGALNGISGHYEIEELFRNHL